MALSEDQIVYILTEYDNDTYSYSGISSSNEYIHLSKKGAEAHAVELGLEIVEYCKDPSKQATLREERVYA